MTSVVSPSISIDLALAQVLLAADYIGLPYGGEHGTELLWIADAFLCPQLPLGSRAHVDRGAAMGPAMAGAAMGAAMPGAAMGAAMAGAAMAGARPRGWSGPGAA